MICGLWEFACCMVSLIPLNQWKRREESLVTQCPLNKHFMNWYGFIWVQYHSSALITQLWCITYMRFLFNFVFLFLAPDTEEEIEGYKEWWIESSKTLWWVEEAIQMRDFQMQSVSAVLMNVFGTIWQWDLARLIPGRFLMLPQATVSKNGTLLEGAINYV